MGAVKGGFFLGKKPLSSLAFALQQLENRWSPVWLREEPLSPDHRNVQMLLRLYIALSDSPATGTRMRIEV
jgi:hypothetical protein